MGALAEGRTGSATNDTDPMALICAICRRSVGSCFVDGVRTPIRVIRSKIKNEGLKVLISPPRS